MIIKDYKKAIKAFNPNANEKAIEEKIKEIKKLYGMDDFLDYNDEFKIEHNKIVMAWGGIWDFDMIDDVTNDFTI